MIVIGAQDMKKDFIEDFKKVQKGSNRVKNGGNGSQKNQKKRKMKENDEFQHRSENCNERI